MIFAKGVGWVNFAHAMTSTRANVRTMRCWLVGFVIAMQGTAAFASDDPWLGSDKAAHFGVSAALGGAAYTVLWLGGAHAAARGAGAPDPAMLRLPLALGMALAPGIAKEIYDAGQPGNRFSGKDLLFDALGAITGAVLFYAIEWLLHPKFSRPSFNPRNR